MLCYIIVTKKQRKQKRKEEQRKIFYCVEQKEESRMNKIKSFMLGITPIALPILSICICGCLFKLFGF